MLYRLRAYCAWLGYSSTLFMKDIESSISCLENNGGTLSSGNFTDHWNDLWITVFDWAAFKSMSTRIVFHVSWFEDISSTFSWSSYKNSHSQGLHGLFYAIKDSHIPVARSPWRPSFVWWRQIFVCPQQGYCCMSPLWRLEFSGTFYDFGQYLYQSCRLIPRIILQSMYTVVVVCFRNLSSFVYVVSILEFTK